MSDQPNKPLYDDNRIYSDAAGQPTSEVATGYSRGAIAARDFYEAERAKLLAEIAELRAVTVEQIMEVIDDLHDTWFPDSPGGVSLSTDKKLRDRLTKLFNGE